jgi:predicted DNA-binding transcriptional regulator AlpA
MANKAVVQGTIQQPQYKRPKQAAQHLQIAVSTLWNYAKTRGGAFKPIKAGPRVTLFDIGAIDRHLRMES